MRNTTSVRVGRLGAFFLLSGATLALILQPTQTVGQAAAPVSAGNQPGYTDDFAKLGFKFDGAQSCANAQCHGADAPQEGKGATTLAEFTQWSGGDKHAKAFETLSNEESGKIAKALGIEANSARCTSCHGTVVDKKLQGKDYSGEEGVTCAACHGPSEKWRDPHKAKGWTEKERVAAKTHEALLKKWGLYDTKGALARADMCTSCHLAIDADMVAAGHPVPSFELDYYSKDDKKGGYYVSQHWRDPKTPFYNVSLWSTGQVVALRDAMNQLAMRASNPKTKPDAVAAAYRQAMGHYSAFKPVLSTKAVAGDIAAWDAQAAKIAAGVTGKKMADVAAGAKAIADGAAKLAPTVSMANFDKPKSVAILKAVLADANASKMYGEEAMLQQAYASYSLWNASNPGAAGKATSDLIVSKLFPPDSGEYKQADFAAGLKAVAAQVK
jgi:hypothetical protein